MSAQVSPVTIAVDKAVKEESPLRRFKGSILIVLTGLVWVAGELAKSPDLAEFSWTAGLGTFATVAAVLLNRFTKDAVTPSMATRLYAKSPEATGYGAALSMYPHLEGDNPTMTRAGGDMAPVVDPTETPADNVTVTESNTYAPRHLIENEEPLPNSAYMAARAQFFEE